MLEIKEIRKKKERAKELEGIDMSNIVTSSRRRSTTSYVAPPKPKLPIESDSDDEENSDDEDDEEEEEDNDGGEENAVGDNGKNNSSQSEEYNEGKYFFLAPHICSHFKVPIESPLGLCWCGFQLILLAYLRNM